ncbi:hypothetical protein RND81_08G193500 [Saponaria officinalis]|uniref:RING-type E3 ubiquitin transferase n=1 Tax=Saponaria officinalis TaxID=3572 RepID=A0AAW1J9S6_SAPOF
MILVWRLILQIAGSYGLPPTPARRTLFVLYQTTVPYLAERMSSKIASRGMLLFDSNSDDFDENNALLSNQSGTSRSTQEFAVVHQTNLMLFYFEGLYYHISKRASGIR